MPKAILVSYAGYPYSPSSFLPDNGLAELAGVLAKEGCDALILDYGTLSTMRRLIPDSIHKKLADIYKRLTHYAKGIGGIVARLILGMELKSIEKELVQFQYEEVGRMAEELAGIVRKEKPVFVGFKLWLGDGFDGSIRMAKRLKREFPGIKIFAGGPQADLLEADIYRITDVFDAVVFGEGEISIPGLLKFSLDKTELKDIPNLIYYSDGATHKTNTARVCKLDDLPEALYDPKTYPAMAGDEKIKIIVFDESRGCPFHCHFCPHAVKSGDNWRFKSTDKIVEEMESYIKKFNIHVFRYAGSSTPPKTTVEVARKLIEKKTDVLYATFAHVRATDAKTLPLLKKSGCYSIFFGIESGDDRILSKVMNKHSSSDDIRRVLKASIDAGLFTVGSVIFPAPTETKESAGKTLSLIKELFGSRPECGSVPVQFPGLYPTSEWGKHPENFGFKIKNPETYKIDMATYKLKLLFPPKYWQPLPYTLNGRSFKQFAAQTEHLQNDLEDAGILTMLADDIALIGRLAGYNSRQYRDISREIFFSGDWKSFREQVKMINKNITTGADYREEIRRSPLSGDVK